MVNPYEVDTSADEEGTYPLVNITTLRGATPEIQDEFLMLMKWGRHDYGNL